MGSLFQTSSAQQLDREKSRPISCLIKINRLLVYVSWPWMKSVSWKRMTASRLLTPGLDNTRIFMSLTAGAGTWCMSLLSSSPNLACITSLVITLITAFTNSWFLWPKGRPVCWFPSRCSILLFLLLLGTVDLESLNYLISFKNRSLAIGWWEVNRKEGLEISSFINIFGSFSGQLICYLLWNNLQWRKDHEQEDIIFFLFHFMAHHFWLFLFYFY